MQFVTQEPRAENDLHAGGGVGAADRVTVQRQGGITLREPSLEVRVRLPVQLGEQPLVEAFFDHGVHLPGAGTVGQPVE